MDIEAKVILRKTGKANLIQTFFIISFGYQDQMELTRTKLWYFMIQRIIKQELLNYTLLCPYMGYDVSGTSLRKHLHFGVHFWN